MKNTIQTIKARAKEAGSHWFDTDTMRFFKSRLLPTIYETPRGLAFVSSEQGPDDMRRYTVRVVTLWPWTIGQYPGTTFGGFATAAKARAFAIAHRS